MRQLILCCDGTNNNFTGGATDTHVVRLRELLAAHNDADQRIFYDPGVGNAGTLPGATWGAQFRGWAERVAGLALGRGVFENIEEGYRFLMQNYQVGDQIFVFGFSRGAFTARSIAGLVNQFGVLKPEARAMVPTLLHLYFSDYNKIKPGEDARPHALTDQIVRCFGQGLVPIHFVGVWDTVASVGLWPLQLKFTTKPRLTGKHFVHVRQALALDEQRAQFQPRPYAQDNGPFECGDGLGAGSFTQLWFRGSHCDVGGGYAPQDSRLSMAPLCWLLSEACTQGLRLTHAGQPLDSEAAVMGALQAHVPPLSSPAGSELRVHSQLQVTPIWAITGMAIRRTHCVELNGAPPVPVKPEEHPSVAEWAAQYPKDTSWARWSPGKADLAMLLLVLCSLLGMRWAAGSQEGAHAFAAWQLAWLAHGWPVAWPEGSNHLLWQLLLDLPLIVGWAWVLSIPASRAFARRAGLRRITSRGPDWIRPLGWALALAVIADLGENLFTLFTLVALNFDHANIASLFAVVMSACSLGKWLGIAGTLLLIASGLLPARKN